MQLAILKDIQNLFIELVGKSMEKRDIKSGKFVKGNNTGRRFTREGSLGNQHAKGNKPNRTTFQKGVFVMEKHPCWKGGVQFVKNDCVYINVGGGKRIRRPKMVWESVYGELPKGYIIIHMDGNSFNDDISNLEAITRAELLKRNLNR